MKLLDLGAMVSLILLTAIHRPLLAQQSSPFPVDSVLQLLEDATAILDKDLTRAEQDRRAKDLERVFAALDARLSFPATGGLPEPLGEELSQSINDVFENVRRTVSLLSVVDTPEYDRLKLLLADHLGAPDIVRDEIIPPENITVLLEAVNMESLDIVIEHLTGEIDSVDEEIASKLIRLKELVGQNNELRTLRDERTWLEWLFDFFTLAEEEKRIEEFNNESDTILREIQDLRRERQAWATLREEYGALGGNLSELLILTDENIRGHITGAVVENDQSSNLDENRERIGDAVTALESILQWIDAIQDEVFSTIVEGSRGEFTYVEMVNAYETDETVRSLEDQRFRIRRIRGGVLAAREMILGDIEQNYRDWRDFLVSYSVNGYSGRLAEQEAGLQLKTGKYRLRLFLHQLSVQDPQVMEALQGLIPELPPEYDALSEFLRRVDESDNERMLREDDFVADIHAGLGEQSVEAFMNDLETTVSLDHRQSSIVEAVLKLIRQGSVEFQDWKTRLEFLVDGRKLEEMLPRIELLAGQENKGREERLEYEMLREDYAAIAAQLSQTIPELALEQLEDGTGLKTVLEEIVDRVMSEREVTVLDLLDPGGGRSSSAEDGASYIVGLIDACPSYPCNGPRRHSRGADRKVRSPDTATGSKRTARGELSIRKKPAN